MLIRNHFSIGIAGILLPLLHLCIFPHLAGKAYAHHDVLFPPNLPMTSSKCKKPKPGYAQLMLSGVIKSVATDKSSVTIILPDGNPILNLFFKKDQKKGPEEHTVRADDWQFQFKNANGRNLSDADIEALPGQQATVSQACEVRLAEDDTLLNKPSYEAISPLDSAVYAGDQMAVEKLLSGGASVSLLSDGYNALHTLAKGGPKDETKVAELVQTLVDAGADLNKRDSRGFAPIHYAALASHEKTVAALHDLGADLAILTDEQKSVVHLAAATGNLEIYQYAATSGVDLDTADKFGLTPLFLSAVEGQSKVTKFLLKQDANPNSTSTKDHLTPLIMAAQNGHGIVVLQLLINGAAVDARAADGATALNQAVRGGHAAPVQNLIRFDANVNHIYADGTTPLIQAASIGSGTLIDILVAAGARIDQAHNSGITPLMTAANSGHTTAVQKLLDHGADLDFQAQSGMTALMWAVQSGRAEVTSLMLSLGADAGAALPDGRTAAELAVSPAVKALFLPQKSSSPDVPTDNPFGSERELIRAIQSKLSELKYKPGVSDGLMGKKTAIAIRNFQSDRTLKVTGEASLGLWDALNVSKE